MRPSHAYTREVTLLPEVLLVFVSEEEARAGVNEPWPWGGSGEGRDAAEEENLASPPTALLLSTGHF